TASGTAAFSGPTDGWLPGESAVGRWTTDPPASPLVEWPQPNRTPLTSVAVAPGSGASLTVPDAIAVGLDGTALHFEPASGWSVDRLPPRESHVNMNSVVFTGAQSAVAVGQFGTIIRWDGASWSEDPQSISLTQSQLNAVAAAPSGELWAVGVFGTILHFDG